MMRQEASPPTPLRRALARLLLLLDARRVDRRTSDGRRPVPHPSMPGFSRYELRTLDLEAAREFYTAVLGSPPPLITPLPPVAISRGAVPHWLGHLGVPSPDTVADALVARGAMRLGPPRDTPNGRVVTLRGPGRAVVAIGEPASEAAEPSVAWPLLFAHALQDAEATYTSQFGWTTEPAPELEAFGVFRTFTGTDVVGSMTDVSGHPGAHPHWLFHFRVPSLAAALATVRARGGVTWRDVELADGARLAACDDPQGAAFGLWQGGA